MIRALKYSLAAFAAAVAGVSSVAAAVDYTPIEFRTVSGIRPFVRVMLNGKPFLFMVHSNAGFYVMTTHANAAAAGVDDLVAKDNYGISSAGHLSGLGRANATLRRLQVGAAAAANVPLAVFEAPQDPPMQGMLGVGWLRARRVILDYDRSRIGFPRTPEESAAEDKRLVAEGYVPHPMAWDENGKSYSVHGVVNGTAVDLDVSTVAENILDTAFARRAGIALGPVVDRYGGPKGATGDQYLAKTQISIVLDGQATAPAQPMILDTYAYDTSERAQSPDAVHTARVGADFMLANRAVIDFGTATLFVRTPEAN
jgi:predicted aspartyl protease